MLYLMVLVVEFSHTVVERYDFPRILHVIEKATIFFVIAGISLSTLHQSSLGTLFLATPYRLHPLWYTDLLPVLFFITSIGEGCLSIAWLTLVIHRFYGVEPPMKSISGLGRIAAVLLGVYLVSRLAMVFADGKADLLVSLGFDSANFWLEIMLSAIIPVALLAVKKYRESPTAMFWISTSVLVGISLNRVNVAGLATQTATQSTYFPIWPEWAVTVGLLSFAALVILFCIEHFRVFDGIDADVVEKAYESHSLDHADWKTFFFRNPLSEVRLYSIMFVLAVGLTFGCLPEDSIFGVSPMKTPVQRPRVVDVFESRNTKGPGTLYVPVSAGKPVQGEGRADVLLIDGNRNGDCVLFDHTMHSKKIGNGDPESSCVKCHHLRKPLAKASSCSECHSDMYLARDLFDHELHAAKLGGNTGCVKCHADPDKPKVRANTPTCEKCHKEMRPADTLVNVTDPGRRDIAPGYMDAMHGLCISCHEKEKDKLQEPNENFARCTNCHRDRRLVEELEPRLGQNE